MSLFQRGDVWWYEFWFAGRRIRESSKSPSKTVAKARSEWYVFPFGKPSPRDPSRPVTTLKTAWNNVRRKAQVKGRWHDNRHTLITDLAESGAGDQTIMDIASHVSKQMLKHYSHIRMEAKRRALESIVTDQGANVEADHKAQTEGSAQKATHGLQNGRKLAYKKRAAAKEEETPTSDNSGNHYSELPADTQHFDVEYPQKSPHSGISEVDKGVEKRCKSMNLLVDAVGIEPTTCRLRASLFALPPAAINCYKSLYRMRLQAKGKSRIAIQTS